MSNNDIKQKLVTEIIAHLQKKLMIAMEAAHNAHSAAVDDQSVAETQYDTLAIEASYLAEGQSKRVLEYQQALNGYQALALSTLDQNSFITLGALVQLAKDSACQHWFFIGPFAGGFRTIIDEQQITVITPQSPMAKALMGKQQNDDIEIILAKEKLIDEIIAVY